MTNDHMQVRAERGIKRRICSSSKGVKHAVFHVHAKSDRMTSFQPTNSNSKSKRSDVASYRPISITAVASKVLKRILTDRIVAHCERYRLPGPHRFGFRPRRSTTLQLTITIDNWLSSFNDASAATNVVFLDFKAAFDMVNHRMLIAKLPSFALSPPLIDCIAIFLSGRSFCVCLACL